MCNSTAAGPKKTMTGVYKLLVQYFRGYFPEKSLKNPAYLLKTDP
jgi:hypothetical protein